jgi:hypothetical protein
MSVKRTIIMAAAALAVVIGAGAAGTLTANAATPECGGACIDIFSAEYGTAAHPNDILAVRNQPAGIGTPITLNTAGTSNPGEDFEADVPGTVHQFYEDGLMPAGMNALYGSLDVYEFQYAPDGHQTNQCVGVATGPAIVTEVTLRACGVTVKTAWIAYPRTTTSGSYFELINGATASDFSDPYVLTTGAPGEPLFTVRLTLDTRFLRLQLWGSFRPFVLS